MFYVRQNEALVVGHPNNDSTNQKLGRWRKSHFGLKMVEPARGPERTARGPERKDNRTQTDSTFPTLIAFIIKDL